MNRLIIVFLFSINSAFLYAERPDVATESKKTQEYIIDKDSPIIQKKFNPNFKDKYKNSSDFDYSNPNSSVSLWTKIKIKIISWLESIFNTDISRDSRQLFDKLFNYASIVILIIVIIFIIRAFIKKEARWFYRKSTKDFAVEYDDIEKDLDKVDFKILISEAIQKNQKRLAIRYHYLLLLQILSKNNIIDWDLEKTNSDYMSEIKDKKTRNTFSYLSYIYNNIWYGEFEIDDNSFEKAKKSFDEFLKSMEK